MTQQNLIISEINSAIFEFWNGGNSRFSVTPFTAWETQLFFPYGWTVLEMLIWVELTDMDAVPLILDC